MRAAWPALSLVALACCLAAGAPTATAAEPAQGRDLEDIFDDEAGAAGKADAADTAGAEATGVAAGSEAAAVGAAAMAEAPSASGPGGACVGGIFALLQSRFPARPGHA